MEPKGLLEELYLGEFNPERFQSFRPLETDPETDAIIQKYLELIKEHPPARLESEGALPEELWKGLKEIGIFGLNISRANNHFRTESAQRICFFFGLFIGSGENAFVSFHDGGNCQSHSGIS